MASHEQTPLPGDFARGIEQDPPTPTSKVVGSFATGAEKRPHDHRRQRRFSQGAEQLPDTPEKEAVRDFAEGIEEDRDAA